MILTRNMFIYFRFSGSGLKRGLKNNILVWNRVRVLRIVRYTPTQTFGEYLPGPFPTTTTPRASTGMHRVRRVIRVAGDGLLTSTQYKRRHRIFSYLAVTAVKNKAFEARTFVPILGKICKVNSSLWNRKITETKQNKSTCMAGRTGGELL